MKVLLLKGFFCSLVFYASKYSAIDLLGLEQALHSLKLANCYRNHYGGMAMWH